MRHYSTLKPSWRPPCTITPLIASYLGLPRWSFSTTSLPLSFNQKTTITDLLSLDRPCHYIVRGLAEGVFPLQRTHPAMRRSSVSTQGLSSSLRSLTTPSPESRHSRLPALPLLQPLTSSLSSPSSIFLPFYKPLHQFVYPDRSNPQGWSFFASTVVICSVPPRVRC